MCVFTPRDEATTTTTTKWLIRAAKVQTSFLLLDLLPAQPAAIVRFLLFCRRLRSSSWKPIGLVVVAATLATTTTRSGRRRGEDGCIVIQRNRFLRVERSSAAVRVLYLRISSLGDVATTDKKVDVVRDEDDEGGTHMVQYGVCCWV